MASSEQFLGESILYRQSVSGDVISSAVWSITPSAVLSNGSQSPTAATTMVSGLALDTKYRLTVTLTLASGQIRKPYIDIRCPKA